jgi:hypothetical protein
MSDVKQFEDNIIRSIEASVVKSIEASVVKFASSPDIFSNNYANRIDIMPLVKRVYGSIDSSRLEKLITEGLEEVLAKKIVDKLVTEMGSDIKNLMGNATVRDDFRFFLRTGVQKILDKAKEV